MTDAPAVPRPATAQDSPYVGLAYFTEENAAFFFGRDAERKRIIGNLRAARLTVLYAPSGVGKSSLLRAGAVARLRELAEQSFAERGAARHLPVVFNTWGEDPVDGLIAAIETAARPFATSGERLELPRASIPDAIDAAAAATGATLLLVLDQFEEYFLYESTHEGTFAEQFADCVNRGDLRANFLIAIREDQYAGLGDLFKGRVANIYGNYLHLEYLGRAAAREAITKPIELFNELHDTERIEIEPELVDAVLDQVTRGSILIGEGGRGTIDSGGGRAEAVETPYLQLVMKRLWDAELAGGSRTLRLATLESMGGAATIIGTHLDQAMAQFDTSEQDVAAAALRFLVTPSGTKIALSASDIAQLAEMPAAEVEQVVERLSSGDVRILRPVASGEGGATRYEIFHDALARPILDWRARHTRTREERELAQRLEEERRQREEAQREALAAQEREARERRRARIFRTAMIVCIAAVLLAAAAFAFALVKKGDADKTARQAQSVLIASRATDAASDPNAGPVVAGLAALEALHLSPTLDADSAALAFLDSNTGAPRRVLVGHSFEINSLAYSPSGTLASGSNDGSVRLWNANGEQIGPALVTTSLKTVNTVAFSRSGDLLASARQDGSIDLWSVAHRSDRPVHTMSNAFAATTSSFKFTGLAFSPTADVLCVGGIKGTVACWNVSDPKQPRSVPGFAVEGATKDGPRINSLAFSPDGSLLAAGDGNGSVTLWDFATRKLLKTFTQGAGDDRWIYTVDFSPDGRTLAGSGDDGIYLWDVANRQQPTFWKMLDGHTDWVFSAAFVTNSTLVSGGRDDTVIEWNLDTGLPVGPPRSHDDWVESVAVSPDGKTFASAGDDRLVKFWPVDGGSPLATTVGGAPEQLSTKDSRRWTWSLSARPDGLIVAASGDAGTLIWKQGSTKPLATLLYKGGTSEAAATHGDLVAAATGRTFGVWRVNASGDARLLAVAPAHHNQDVYSLSFSADGRFVATTDEETVDLWSVSSSGSIGFLTQLPRVGIAENRAIFSPDGNVLATADDDGYLRLYDVTDPKHVTLLSRHKDQAYALFDAAFSPDGKLLATGGPAHLVLLLDVSDPRHPSLVAQMTQTNSITSVAFSPDGSLLAAGDGSSRLYLWDVDSKQRLGSGLIGRSGRGSDSPAIDTLAFAPDGSALYSAGRGNPIVAWQPILWSHDAKRLAQAICQIAGRNLTAPERLRVFGGTPLAHSRHKTCPQYPLP